MLRKKFILVVAAIAVIGVSIFFACEKDLLTSSGGIKSHKSSTFYDQALLERFMDESLVRDFQTQIESFGITKVNGILKFQNVEDMNTVYDLLTEYSDEWDRITVDNPEYIDYIESEGFPTYPITYAFEVINNFYSLHTHIENQMLILDAGDGISFEDNDPDDHFIESPFMRVLLTPNCEIIVNNIIFIEGDKYTVQIDNLNMEYLQLTQNLIHSLGEEKGMESACLKGYATQSGDSHKSNGCCDAITIVDNPACDNSCMFYLRNLSTCSIDKCHWDFGDGSQGYSDAYQSVSNIYRSKGTYVVTADITFRNGSSCKVTKNVAINNKCYIDVNKFVANGTSGDVSFSVTQKQPNCGNTYMKSFKWDFGDGTTITDKNSTIQYQYKSGGKKKVTVTVTFDDGCTANEIFFVELPGKDDDDCCKARDRERSRDKIQYACVDKSIKHVFAVRNGPLWHRIVVRSIHFETNKKGNWKRKKADKLLVGYVGNVWDKGCDSTWAVSGTKDKSKQIEITLDRYGNRVIFEAFRLKKNSIGSFYEVEDGNCITPPTQNGFSLHEKSCN